MHVLPRSTRAVACASLALMAACGVTDPAYIKRSGIHFIAAPTVADTVDAHPVQALVAELRDDNGNPLSGVILRFETQAPDTAQKRGSAAVCRLSQANCFGSPLAVDTTDSQGRAHATINMGTVPGTAKVLVIAPALNKADTTSITVLPGAAAKVRATFADTLLDVNGTATLRAIVVDRYDNLRSEVATLSTGSATTITLAAATGVITAREFGTQYIFARTGTLVDSTRVRVVPPGRLVVWSQNSGAVDLVNLNGTSKRTVVASTSSDGGVLPRFDAARQRVVLATGSLSSGIGGQANKVIVADTSGTVLRDIRGLFVNISATRLLPDGTLLVIGLRSAGEANALFRVAADNSLTLLANLPDLQYQYNEADISPDGTRVAYLAPVQALRELRMLVVATGAVTTLSLNARSPRWSKLGDRIAFLVSVTGGTQVSGGSAAVINPDGTGKQIFGPPYLAEGIAWSPDGAYLVAGVLTTFRVPDDDLCVLRISDGATVLLKFKNAAGQAERYTQPDWR